MPSPILNAPTPNQHKLDILRQHFPQAVEVDAQGHIRINATGLQQAIDPSNPAGIQVEEDGYELRWVGKGYDNQSDIPTREKRKIESAKQFFKALQELPVLKEKGLQIQYQTKINGESLAQLISDMK